MTPTKVGDMTRGEGRVARSGEQLVAAKYELDGELVIVRHVSVGDLRVQPGRVAGTFRRDTVGDLPHPREPTRRASLHRAKLGERLAGLVLGHADLDEEQVHTRVEELMAELLPERAARRHAAAAGVGAGARRSVCTPTQVLPRRCRRPGPSKAMTLARHLLLIMTIGSMISLCLVTRSLHTTPPAPCSTLLSQPTVTRIGRRVLTHPRHAPSTSEPTAWSCTVRVRGPLIGAGRLTRSQRHSHSGRPGEFGAAMRASSTGVESMHSEKSRPPVQGQA